MRRSVSGEMPSLKEEESNSVIVRHVPFTDMESPREASVRMSAQLDIVIEVPEPPVRVASCWRRDETAVPLRSVRERRGGPRERFTANSLDNTGEHGG